MYNFVEVGQVGEESTSPVALIYNGTNIDETIEGFQTLNVHNREVANRVANLADIKNGKLILDESIERDPIRVEYAIQTDDEETFKESYKQLLKIIFEEGESFFTFVDEEVEYFGIATSITKDDTVMAQGFGEIELTLTSVYKYSPEIETTGAIETTNDELTITAIEVDVGSDTEDLRITKGEQTIRFVEPIAQGDTIFIRFRENEIYKNDERFDYGLALDSDFENFQAESGETVETNNGSLRIWYRTRWL